jgi:hypothetical protein
MWLTDSCERREPANSAYGWGKATHCPYHSEHERYWVEISTRSRFLPCRSCFTYARTAQDHRSSLRGDLPQSGQRLPLTMQRNSASQNENIGDSHNCRHTNPPVAPGKLSWRPLRLRLSRNVVLQPK